MRKLIFLFIAGLCLIVSCNSNINDNADNLNIDSCGLELNENAPKSSWFKGYNGSGEESHGHFIMSCIDGGFLQVGETGYIPSSKILVIKTDNAGDLLWSKEIGQLKSNLGNAVIESDDAYLVVGALDENSAIIKLEKSSGEIISSKTFDLGGSDAFEHIVEYQNELIAVGYNNAIDSQNTFFTEGQATISVLSETGNLIETKSINEYLAQAYRIEVYNNYFFVSGLSDEANDYVLLKMDTSLNVIWSKRYGGIQSDHNFGMDIDLDGNIFLTGHTLSDTENWDTYTMKINLDGDKIWESKVGNPRGFDPKYIHDETWDVKGTNDGGCIIVAGSGDEYENYNAYCDSNGTFSNQWVVYLIKFSESGKVEWQNIYFDTEGGDWAGEAITLTNENEAVVAVDNGSFGFLKINSF